MVTLGCTAKESSKPQEKETVNNGNEGAAS
jgi:hypothetical protein